MSQPDLIDYSDVKIGLVDELITKFLKIHFLLLST